MPQQQCGLKQSFAESLKTNPYTFGRLGFNRISKIRIAKNLTNWANENVPITLSAFPK